jgi:hypothetical protein
METTRTFDTLISSTHDALRQADPFNEFLERERERFGKEYDADTLRSLRSAFLAGMDTSANVVGILSSIRNRVWNGYGT